MAQEQWTILKIIEWTKQYFASKALEEPRLDAEILLCDVLHCQRVHLYVNFDQPLSEEELAQYRGYVARRAAKEPLAYILGKQAFMDFEFKVDASTLVPRPETELLVEKVQELYAAHHFATLLDVGSGSGAINLSLLKYCPELKATAVDINPAALAKTQENAEDLGVAERLTTVVSDVYAALGEQRFEAIVSNPPYIPTQVLGTLAADVQQEPRLALDGGADGLVIYRRLLAEAPEHLTEDGFIAMEIGYDQGRSVQELARAAGFGVTKLLKDYAQLDRMIFAAKEGSRYAHAIMELKTK